MTPDQIERASIAVSVFELRLSELDAMLGGAALALGGLAVAEGSDKALTASLAAIIKECVGRCESVRENWQNVLATASSFSPRRPRSPRPSRTRKAPPVLRLVTTE